MFKYYEEFIIYSFDVSKPIDKLYYGHIINIIKDIEIVKLKTNLFNNKKIENKWNEFIKKTLSFEF